MYYIYETDEGIKIEEQFFDSQIPLIGKDEKHTSWNKYKNSVAKTRDLIAKGIKYGDPPKNSNMPIIIGQNYGHAIFQGIENKKKRDRRINKTKSVRGEKRGMNNDWINPIDVFENIYNELDITDDTPLTTSQHIL